jgi:hypothetical protein
MKQEINFLRPETFIINCFTKELTFTIVKSIAKKELAMAKSQIFTPSTPSNFVTFNVLSSFYFSTFILTGDVPSLLVFDKIKITRNATVEQ